MIVDLFRRYRELIVYCMIGATGATLDFIVYSALAKGCGMHYQLANFLSVSFGIVNNFFLNYHFNFNVKTRFWARLASFYAIGMEAACALLGQSPKAAVWQVNTEKDYHETK